MSLRTMVFETIASTGSANPAIRTDSPLPTKRFVKRGCKSRGLSWFAQCMIQTLRIIFSPVIPSPRFGVYYRTFTICSSSIPPTYPSLTDRMPPLSASLLHDLFSALPHGVVAYQAVRNETGAIVDFNAIFYNEAGLRMSGHTADQLDNQTLFERIPYQQEAVDELCQLVSDRHELNTEYLNPVLNRWLTYQISPLGDGFFATFQDIDDRKRLELELEARNKELQKTVDYTARQQQLFDNVLNSITNGLSILDAIRDEQGQLMDLRYIRVSRALTLDVGMSEAQLLGNTMLTLFPDVKRTIYWRAYQEVLQTGIPQQFEGHYVGEGISKHSSNHITRLSENQLVSVYVLINDRVNAETQVREQATILESVLDSCQMTIVLFAAIRNAQDQIVDFRYVFQNETNARTVGLPIASTYDKTMLEVLPSLKPSGVFDRYVRVVETGESQRFEQQLCDGCVDGWFDFSVVKQGDGIVVAANDQTLLHQTLQRAEQLVQALRQSNQNLEQFAYVASHDLQEPLRKIQSFGDLLLSLYAQSLPTDAQDILNRMQLAAGRMSILIRDLLTYSRLSLQPAPFQPVNLNQIVAGVLTDLELSITDKQAQINDNTQASSTLPVLRGEPTQLRQLFQNLIGNALKFTRPGVAPQISLTARPVLRADLPDSLASATISNWVAIAVEDNGIGFSEEHGQRIFQLFERLHGRNEYAGTGIGLSVCLKVAENHGGTITAQGQPGQGATFSVYLPVSE